MFASRGLLEHADDSRSPLIGMPLTRLNEECHNGLKGRDFAFAMEENKQ